MFGQAVSEPDVHKMCRNSDDGTRITTGVPDHPYSLMEGAAGDIAFLSDLLGNEMETRCPGFEV